MGEKEPIEETPLSGSPVPREVDSKRIREAIARLVLGGYLRTGIIAIEDILGQNIREIGDY